MIKSKTGNSVKFSSTPTGSRTVSREQSMQARSLAANGSQRENDEDEDEIIAPPKSRTRAEREADETPAPEEEEEVVGAEEEEEELPDQSWGAMMGYGQVEEEDYGYNDMGDDDW
jgi:transcription factor IIIB subunit 2